MHCHVLLIPIHFNGLPENRSSHQKFIKNLQSPQAAHRSNVSGFDVIFGSPYGLAASPYAGAVSHVLWYFPYVFVAPPCDSAASHAGHIPIGFAASPYGHTPAASPHTSRQIPIGRPFSHTPRQIPHSQAISPYDPQAPKIRLQIRRDQRSGSTNPQPTLTSKHPEPALPSSKPIPNRFQQITRVTVQQTNLQQVHANHTCLRLGGTVTSCVRTPSRAYLHGHAFDETSVRLEQIYASSLPTQIPCGCVTPPQIHASDQPTQMP